MLQQNRRSIYTLRDTDCLEDSKNFEPAESHNEKSDTSYNEKDETKMAEASGILQTNSKPQSTIKKCVRFAKVMVRNKEPRTMPFEMLDDKEEEEADNEEEEDVATDATPSTSRQCQKICKQFGRFKIDDEQTFPDLKNNEEQDIDCEIDDYNLMESAGTGTFSVGRCANKAFAIHQLAVTPEGNNENQFNVEAGDYHHMGTCEPKKVSRRNEHTLDPQLLCVKLLEIQAQQYLYESSDTDERVNPAHGLLHGAKAKSNSMQENCEEKRKRFECAEYTIARDSREFETETDDDCIWGEAAATKPENFEEKRKRYEDSEFTNALGGNEPFDFGISEGLVFGPSSSSVSMQESFEEKRKRFESNEFTFARQNGQLLGSTD